MATPAFEDKNIATVPGHWLLARLGKRVLRPGGLALTKAMLRQAHVTDADIVEIAPGIGRTAQEILQMQPKSYRGIDANPDAVALVNNIVAAKGSCQLGCAQKTDLASSSADVVVGEAMLTMQTLEDKKAIIGEAFRILRPGGRYAIHELGLLPDDIDDELKKHIHQDVTRAIKVQARPLTTSEWTQLLVNAGFVVRFTQTAPMLLMDPRRNLADEGFVRVLRILKNALTIPGALSRVKQMRATFARYKDSLCGIALVAEKPKK
ncbi:class I SAM-dependent methyltransferase [Atopobium deltae]|uniref:Methyltransferase domain protein n=1 Tax=Atopobium deltae TaxID=1393034 RepID=A0A133XUT3_9ACTN|nr:class I SAM-dependent methyltransferase [Atopobium deltae]KXB34698.1 methyltransferase domain protein [Atopobium deltae]